MLEQLKLTSINCHKDACMDLDGQVFCDPSESEEIRMCLVSICDTCKPLSVARSGLFDIRVSGSKGGQKMTGQWGDNVSKLYFAEI